jgi:hypothetical protein
MRIVAGWRAIYLDRGQAVQLAPQGAHQLKDQFQVHVEDPLAAESLQLRRRQQVEPVGRTESMDSPLALVEPLGSMEDPLEHSLESLE